LEVHPENNFRVIMPSTIYRGIGVFALIAVCGLGIPMQAAAENDWETHRKGQIEEEVKKIGKELARTLIQELKGLENELKRLNQHRQQDRRPLEDRLNELKGRLQGDPENAEAHFKMGEIFDSLGDGASAIIHTQQAESLFAQQKQVKGVAEARRNLRRYFNKYGFQRDDFILPAE